MKSHIFVLDVLISQEFTVVYEESATKDTKLTVSKSPVSTHNQFFFEL